MLKIFEKLDSWYYTNSDEIMKICSILFLFLIVASYVVLKRKDKWTYSLFDCIRVIKYGIFALWIKFAYCEAKRPDLRSKTVAFRF